MAKLTLNHVITRLLREGIIDARKNQTHFDTLLDLRSEVENHLRVLGMELVVLADMRVAHYRKPCSSYSGAARNLFACHRFGQFHLHKRSLTLRPTNL